MNPHVGRMLAALLLLIGTLVFLYPTIASWNYQRIQSDVINAYGKSISTVRPDAREQLAEAHAYNRALQSGANLLPNAHKASGNVAASQAASQGLWAYKDILKADDTGLMARILVPAADIDLPIYHGSDDATLLRGAGHLEGTSLPVGGEGTRTVITAHRGLAQAKMFTNLDRVKVGDTFMIEVFGQVLSYRVFDIKVVEPSDAAAIQAVPGRDLATLVTCTPLGINTHRILVTGERIFPTPTKDVAQALAKSDLPRFPWWIVILSLVFAIVVYIWATSGYKLVHGEARAPRHLRPAGVGAGAPSGAAAVAGDDANANA